MPKQRVLVAGATGYLGSFIVKELKRRGYWVRALVRDTRKAEPVRQAADDLFVGEATQPETLEGICEGIDTVISSLGITKQKDGFTYMDVDYQANRNLLDKSIEENVARFMYISVFNAHKLRYLAIVKAKEKFAGELKKAGIEHIIVRPNGFFSDMSEFFNMAKRGRVYLFGNGQCRGNPIHGEDLARACVERLGSNGGEFDIGGPEILTQNEIAAQSLRSAGKKAKDHSHSSLDQQADNEFGKVFYLGKNTWSYRVFYDCIGHGHGRSNLRTTHHQGLLQENQRGKSCLICFCGFIWRKLFY